VKLPLLLSQYLREHQKLSLPGLGIFLQSPAPAAEADAPAPPASIHFERKTIIEPEDSLIEFIKQKTGKIKPLAMADLSSYIESGLQLLNIGKPFYIEGIGSIQKTRDGQYEFIQREVHATQLHEPISEKAPQPEKKQAQKQSVFEDEKYSPSSSPWQKIIVAVLILGGLAIVVFGGYYLYNQNNDDTRLMDEPAPRNDSTNIIQDSLSRPAPDTTQNIASYAANNPGSYKFILETTNSKKRALKRYNQLKSYFLDVKMETVDSSSFKLYFLIPAAPHDTTRIKDSLSRYYTSKVRIE